MRGFSGEKLRFDSLPPEEGKVEKKEKGELVSLSPEIEYFLHKTSIGRLLFFMIKRPKGLAIKDIDIKKLRGKTFPQDMLRLRAEGLIKADEGKLKPSFQIKGGKVPKSVLEKLKEIFFETPDGKILREIERNPGILTPELASKLSVELHCSEAFIKRTLKEMGDFGLIIRERAKEKARARGVGGQSLANFPKEREWKAIQKGAEDERHRYHP